MTCHEFIIMEIFFRRKFHPVLGILARDITNQPHFLNTLFKTELKPLKKKALWRNSARKGQGEEGSGAWEWCASFLVLPQSLLV